MSSTRRSDIRSEKRWRAFEPVLSRAVIFPNRTRGCVDCVERRLVWHSQAEFAKSGRDVGAREEWGRGRKRPHRWRIARSLIRTRTSQRDIIRFRSVSLPRPALFYLHPRESVRLHPLASLRRPDARTHAHVIKCSL